MSELIGILNDKKNGNADAITILSDRTPGNQKNVDLFLPVCINVDTQIVSIAASIVTLQNEIVTLASAAYAVGCGSTGAATVVYPDIVRAYSYNLTSPSYSGDSPYDITSVVLNPSNVGIGTLLVYTQNDSSQSGIGSLYSNVGTCRTTFPGCVSGTCISYASSITSKQSQITTLRSQLPNLISSSNKVKAERVEYEIQRYADTYTIRILGEENTRISLAITTIQSYS
jgi:hypothetical protein